MKLVFDNNDDMMLLPQLFSTATTITTITTLFCCYSILLFIFCLFFSFLFMSVQTLTGITLCFKFMGPRCGTSGHQPRLTCGSFGPVESLMRKAVCTASMILTATSRTITLSASKGTAREHIAPRTTLDTFLLT